MTRLMPELYLTTIVILAGGLAVAAFWLGYFNLLTFLGCATGGFGSAFVMVKSMQAVKQRLPPVHYV